MIFSAVLEKRMYFNIKADNETEALEWLQTHDYDDVTDKTTLWDVEYNDRIEEVLPDDAEYGVDISTEKENEE